MGDRSLFEQRSFNCKSPKAGGREKQGGQRGWPSWSRVTKGRPAGDEAKLPGWTSEGSEMLRSAVAFSLVSLRGGVTWSKFLKTSLFLLLCWEETKEYRAKAKLNQLEDC